MIINIGDDILLLQSLKLLNKLLADKTTKKNIMWATDAYKTLGGGYERDREIVSTLITGRNAGVIKTRARKAMELQSERTRQHAEVFTPMWVVRKMNDHADEVWFGAHDVFFYGEQPTAKVVFPPNRTWQEYVDSRRMELTCGEAPYLTTRYDVETGEAIPVSHRAGLLDRKLRVVAENTTSEEEWLQWAFRALQSTYGYEFQGDNVLIARVNMLMTFAEHLFRNFGRRPTLQEYAKAANITAWNIWQMDGLTGTIPYSKAEEPVYQMSIFDVICPEEHINETPHVQPYCRIYNWRSHESLEYQSLKQGRKVSMKFDYIIGNPPYQDESIGDNPNDKPPIYHLFMDEAYKISDRVELIHPARFLFDAGKTPKAWNRKMLADPHFRVLYFNAKSKEVFPAQDIKGGVAITYHDMTQNFGVIETFVVLDELRSIMYKVKTPRECNLRDIVYTQTKFNLPQLLAEHPEVISGIGTDGKDKRLEKNIFEKVSTVFFEEPQEDSIKILGMVDNRRVYKYIVSRYIDKTHANLYKYKVLVPTSNGSGALGEVLSTPLIGSPLIGSPLIGYTRSFIGIGAFDTQEEAEAALKYVKSKFARTMLGILKVTQDNNRDTWRYVPMQDFTVNSDIDWSQSVSGIDRQLYEKYGLDDGEIAFIETHVREMR